MRLPAFAILALSAIAGAQTSVVTRPKPSELETLAAREVVRYVYLRTGKLLPIRTRDDGGGIWVGRRAGSGLKPQEYVVKTVGRRTVVVGGDDVGVLYGAYRLAHLLGVRFYLHGDVVPSRRLGAWPKLYEEGKPLFALRGIQPFHDFPEGPDWWNQDDYRAVIGQLPKLRMNWIGFHTYPEGGVGPEPLVWIGPKDQVRADGTVGAAYPSAWANTLRPGMWGNAATPTSEFSAGAANLFEADAFGPDVMRGLMPGPKTPEQSRTLFDRVAASMRPAFAWAKSLGVQTCVGTETPLTVPRDVANKDPKALYEGIFERLRRAMPVDFYWLWTPEDWTWSGNTPEQLERTVADIRAALGALPADMRLATSGWVLGPQNDRTALDRLLPKSVPVSAINRQVGHAAIDPAFGAIQGRSKWAIPWLENDPAMTIPQLWVGRMRADAVDARRYGCDGLMGIHWRTKAIAPNVAALADAQWSQPWPRPASAKSAFEVRGGSTASFGEPVRGAFGDERIYQTVRYGMEGYAFDVPNGDYRVTLKFNEPHYAEPGKRVFGAKVQGKTVIERLDLFERFGRNVAYDAEFPARVVDGRLRVDFVPIVEYPCVAGIAVEGPKAIRVNCGGPALPGFLADDVSADNPDRTTPVLDFYRDFARANFGDPRPGDVLASVDGRALPETATWNQGPGGLKIGEVPASRFAFVDRLAAHRPKAGPERARFDYWLATFRYLQATAEVGGIRSRLDARVAANDFEGALRERVALARAWERMMGWMMRTVDTPGELGTVANLEQHVLRTLAFLNQHDEAIAKGLGRPLGPEARLSKVYAGPPRIIVPTVRTTVFPGERLRLKAILLGTGGGSLLWREMGRGSYRKVALRPIGRSVFEAVLPVPTRATHLEYRIVSGAVAWPAGETQTLTSTPLAKG